MYLNLGVPSFLYIRWTLFKFIDSGLPPQGTKKSPWQSGFKWKLFLKWRPDSINYPFGKVLFSSVTKIKYPLGDKGPLNAETIRRDLAKISNCYLLIPSGSNKTPLPSTTPIIFSCPMRISFDPRSPSGPPVMNLVHSSSLIIIKNIY